MESKVYKMILTCDVLNYFVRKQNVLRVCVILAVFFIIIFSTPNNEDEKLWLLK